ncbi:hypothetical protein N7462_000494 [Penicillium macrosclerotiorum]|uniref:uncharacterized protein n=1 Tax=Penicillium macrosclerotiorum TaxID=303699 RepID=UPI002548239C|nr:uncharacterized protein N7462_000494 [Penicillium macrosclerotiorum]KAJ5698489.1 hypothetical protein N7462_000494 [Penicillium macrosclerotiorum]
MTRTLLAATAAFIHLATAQQIGSIPEIHPQLQTWKCTTKRGCIQQKTSVVLDALSHPLHEVGNSSVSCGDWDSGLNPTLCATEESCAKNCVLEGVDYASHGVSTKGGSLVLHQYMKTNGAVSSVSPRVYLLDETGKNYDMLKLLNQEISFDVDVSSLVCGMNGALYLSEMLQTGGRSELNPAGSQYGTGYCDAQCGVSPWINGVANIDSAGSCCNEMDLWEANARATAYTPHACNISRLYECTGDSCGSSGVCDKSGCGYNPYALGDHNYYGYQQAVDTTKPFTVVTQFLTDSHTAGGVLSEIRRLYVQGGKVIQNAVVTVSGSEIDSITDDYCSESASYFEQMGGLKQMGKAIGRGMVLIFSIWNDSGAFMNWLDSGSAGPCNSTEGNPALIQAQHPDTSVTFSNIKWGDIGSTYSH